MGSCLAAILANNYMSRMEEHFMEEVRLTPKLLVICMPYSRMSHCVALCQTAELAAANMPDLWRAEALRSLAGQLGELSSQIVLAGRSVFALAHGAELDQFQTLGGSSDGFSATSHHAKAALHHFELMRNHWADSAERMRALVDEVIDSGAFITAQGEPFVAFLRLHVARRQDPASRCSRSCH
ncbi:unnamed protein product [Protopolystoma xenopodis]|uniref:Uncharacterized protein n=1 Tax=Protopolystoma xenopodis TaxID=117903 RepID=A0A448XH58_9PLAT|nr:unnamed protein product [Protopolystoma xenopodis]